MSVCVFWKGCQEGFIVGDPLNLFTHMLRVLSVVVVVILTQ